MSDQPVRHIKYDDDHFIDLMSRLKQLSTYSQVADWDQEAQGEITHIEGVIKEIGEELAVDARELEKAKQEFQEKSFLTRIIKGRKEEQKINKHSEQFRAGKANLEDLSTRLQEAIAFTPNNAQEKKELLEELKLRKEGLLLEKQEITAAMKAVRVQARQQSARVGSSFLGYQSRVASIDRRNIRYAKEKLLQPQEDELAAIKRQILQVEKDIHWAKIIKE